MEKLIIHTSGYCFRRTDEALLAERKAHFLDRGEALGLKGTILLGTEGVNLMLAGSEESIKIIQKEINTLFEADIMFKDSVCRTQPFNRLLVKVKKEVVTMGADDLDVFTDTSAYVSPKQLKQWIDQGHDDDGRKFIILDTRNDYEVRLGTFDGAQDFSIRHFREFPHKIDALDPRDYDDITIVTCCTGGIRCEKGAPLMVKRGFKHVYQLEGGILSYFKECGGTHWHGDCFVFDHRVALDPQMNETSTVQCFSCRMPVTQDEQKLDSYLFGEHCPHCDAPANIAS